MPRPRFDWQLPTQTLRLGDRTLLMGIVNLTPDSFSHDGLASLPPQQILTHALTLLDTGADILDLGAESTRPDATPLTADQELTRLLPTLRALRAARPSAVLSVDTYHAATALASARAGADIINDVSAATWDPEMPAAIAASGCAVVLSHTRGRPSVWRSQSAFPHPLKNVLSDLKNSLENVLHFEVPAERIIVDPGFGFGKRGQENFDLLAHLADLHTLGHPLLAGLSRKHFLPETPAGATHKDDHPRLLATQAAGAAAILAGVHILRVHDVAAARTTADTTDAILKALETP